MSMSELLRVQVVVNDDNDGVALAAFSVLFDADVLGFVRSAKGTYLASAVAEQVVNVTEKEPGRLDVIVTTGLIPQDIVPEPGPQPLLDLFFLALSQDTTELSFAPTITGELGLITAAGQTVAGVSFVGPVIVTVSGPLLASIVPNVPVLPGTVTLTMYVDIIAWEDYRHGTANSRILIPSTF